MLIKKLNPKTPGTRHQILIDKNCLSKTNYLLKSNIKGIKFQAGRSPQTGHITSWHKGGIKKKVFRILKLNFENTIYIIISTFYDPNRNGYINLKYNFFQSKFELSLATNKLPSGTLLENGYKSENFKPGYFLPLDNIPIGSHIHSITNINLNKIIWTKSAGTSSQLIQKTNKNVKIKLSSGKIISAPLKLFATIGKVSNKSSNLKVIGKAGKARIIGKRPIVRGVAMNAVDHPHGGQTSGGRPSVSPWGKLTKGVSTKKKIYV